ncbi:MAG: helix-turn-helix domain containing protein [Halioglobus sp.]|nr:helix-turn-helix domain containing protein [Halioglobus sp.]
MEGKKVKNSQARLGATAVVILTNAERLFATKGIDSVSMREISRASGQKNNSALQYHFGDRDELINAILDYRMIPLNQRRLQMVAEIEYAGQTNNVRKLVSAIVLPFVSAVSKCGIANRPHIWRLQAPEESYYISLMSQLFARHQAHVVFNGDESRASGLWSLLVYLAGLLGLSDEEFVARMEFTGTQIVHAVAGWDHLRRTQPELMTNEMLTVRSEWLISFVEGALLNKPLVEN